MDVLEEMQETGDDGYLEDNCFDVWDLNDALRGVEQSRT